MNSKTPHLSPSCILCETESFSDFGGWIPDSQFVDEMGSPYLLAHGMGKPVEDASTILTIPQSGTYRVWARTKDWMPGHHPGQFSLLVNGSTIGHPLGASGRDWSWEFVGQVDLKRGSAHIALHDLTGFEGRCDALFFTLSGDAPPESGKSVNRSWRKMLLNIPREPTFVGNFDVIVVGGGMAGCAAALAAARTGSTVALIHNRPVLGGNASQEVGLSPRGYTKGLVSTLISRQVNGDPAVASLLDAEPYVTVFRNEHLFSAQAEDGQIRTVDTRNTYSSRESRFSASLFLDCSGQGALGKLVGADLRAGRESKWEFDESLAPEKADKLHHGHTVLYHLHNADTPVPLPEMPWATEVAKDFSDLRGQMGALGRDNRNGPGTGASRHLSQTAKKIPALVKSIATDHRFPPEEIIDIFPGTHFWEYGQDLELSGNEETIRDHLMAALYGTLYNIKKAEPEKYARLEFAWMHIVPARGEYCRLMVDYILNENDVRQHKEFPDQIVLNDSAFCIHCAGDPTYDFRLRSWIWDMRDGKPYAIPFRCLYSRNISNLMMAGKQISVSRVVGSNTKMMANGAQHGIAIGCAASLCRQYGVSPRELCQSHMAQLQQAVKRFS